MRKGIEFKKKKKNVKQNYSEWNETVKKKKKYKIKAWI